MSNETLITDVAKDMATNFDMFTVSEIIKGVNTCAVQLNKLALQSADQGQTDLAIDYMRDSDSFANLELQLNKLLLAVK
jgi:hypothetical protein